ncbi:MAG: hypothetical protein EA353_12220 [Puniceicoccaceae bacterium]|nr:MAG: hypothetical protein EA353_12220 [Puniceicoccaceae bacterium]
MDRSTPRDFQLFVERRRGHVAFEGAGEWQLPPAQLGVFAGRGCVEDDPLRRNDICNHRGIHLRRDLQQELSGSVEGGRKCEPNEEKVDESSKHD